MLRAFTKEAVALDSVMRSPNEDLGGLSVLAALDDPEAAETAWRVLRSLGDG